MNEIIKLYEDCAYVKLNVDFNIDTILNKYIGFEDDIIVVGEVVSYENDVMKINFIGEISSIANNKSFSYGVLTKPKKNSNIRLLTNEEVDLLVKDKDDESKSLYIGKMSNYENMPVNIDINQFFSNHFSIFGNTGSGKSSSLASILQSIFYNSNDNPHNANIFIFDVYNEYKTAFSTINKKFSNLAFKTYTTDFNEVESEANKLLKLPLWLLTVDDYALLLNATEQAQLTVIKKALNYVALFNKDDITKESYMTDILARSLLDILTSGKPAIQIRDQVLAVLTTYNTKTLNLTTAIVDPGFRKRVEQCINIDSLGKLVDAKNLIDFLQTLKIDSKESGNYEANFYTLEDLQIAFDYALISEGVFQDARIYEKYNELRVRLLSLVNSDYSRFFDVKEYIGIDKYIIELLTISKKYKAQIIHFNISNVDDRFASSIVKIYSNMLFKFITSIKNRGSISFHVIIEEAHRYVKEDKLSEVIGYNIFDRIAKEGRKYGIILGLISQRPCELSETTLSQCSNYLIFKLQHPKDVAYISSVIPNISENSLKKMKLLTPGSCILFGTAAKIPLLINIDRPNPMPTNSNADVANTWFVG